VEKSRNHSPALTPNERTRAPPIVCQHPTQSHKGGAFGKQIKLRRKAPSLENFINKKPIFAAERQSARQPAIHSFSLS